MPDPDRRAAPLARPTGNRRKFKSHLINHDLRLRLVLDDTIFALVAALAAIGILYVLSNREIGDSMYSAHISIKETRELLHHGVTVAGVVTFVAVMLFGLWSLLDAHRIAGPMHRLHRLLREIGAGDLTHEIKFRRRDEFAELAQAADTMVETHARVLNQVRARIAAAETALGRESISPEQLSAAKQHIIRARESLAFFTLPAAEAGPQIDGTPLDPEEDAA